MKREYSILFVLLIICFASIAQKLPNVQEKSLRAPANIKVDGKSLEWNNQFQAYNKATEIFYTISNDNDKLYLAVQTKDMDIMNKIISAGVTLTVNGSGKMKDQGGRSIIFPALGEHYFPVNAPPVDFKNRQNKPVEQSEAGLKEAEEFMTDFNKDLTSKARIIRTEGITELQDSLLSIYNPEGFKAAALMDNGIIFTCELAIPLKYLGLSVNESKSFTYNIKLNMNRPFIKALRVQRTQIRAGITSLRPLGTGPDREYEMGGPTALRAKELMSPTDFWAEYTLAK